MSEETKTVLLKVELDQQAANKNLQETEKNIISLKTQQKELNDEFKKGKITQDEYIQSKIKLDTQLKQESQSRATLQKAIIAENNSLGAQKALLSDLINQRERVDRSSKEGAERFQNLTGKIKELNDSMMKVKKESGGLTEAFLQFSEKAKVGEFELEKITKLMPLISSPALAAGAAIATLGSAYANSAAGGKDLEEAQNRLKAQWEIFSGTIAGEVGEGEGLIGAVTKNLLGIGKGFIAAGGDVLTLGMGGFIKAAEEEDKAVGKVTDRLNKLTELQFEQLQNEVIASKQRKEAYEFTVQRADAELREGETIEKSLERRLEAAHKVVELQKESVEGSVEALKKQAQTLFEIGELTNNNVLNEKNISPLRRQYLQLLVQIQELETSRERKISQAEIAEKNLTNELEKQQKLAAFERAKSKDIVDFNKPKEEFDAEKEKKNAQTKANIKKFENDLLNQEQKRANNNYESLQKERFERDQEKERDHEELIRKRIRMDAAYVEAQRGFGRLAGAILGRQSEEYKTFASAQAIMSTYLAADKALAEVPFPADIAAAAGIIAEGLANVVEINKAAGGGSFVTSGPTMLMVGDNPGGIERVDVTPVSGKGETKINSNSGLLQLGGGGSIMAQGGLVTSQMSQSVNQEIALRNAFKNMPQPVVSWKEGLIVGARVEVKEKLTRA